MPNYSDEFFSKIEKKTKVNKDAIISLAKKLQSGNMKDENLLKEVISEISEMTGKEVSPERQQKIIDTIINDKVPNDLDKYIN